jgi:hypothetical protein
MATTETLIRLYENAKPQRAQCRACAADIEWFETLRGRKMPMNAGAVPRKSTNDAATGRVIVFFAAEDAHWNTCPDASKFGGHGKR